MIFPTDALGTRANAQNSHYRPRRTRLKSRSDGNAEARRKGAVRVHLHPRQQTRGAREFGFTDRGDDPGWSSSADTTQHRDHEGRAGPGVATRPGASGAWIDRTAATRLSGGLIDRSRTVGFTFDGRRFAGHPGDTLASALMANDVALLGRSFKYHRPRGLIAAGSGESPTRSPRPRAVPRAPPTHRGDDGRASPTALEGARPERLAPLRLRSDGGQTTPCRRPSPGLLLQDFHVPAAPSGRRSTTVIRRPPGLGRPRHRGRPRQLTTAASALRERRRRRGPADGGADRRAGGGARRLAERISPPADA